MAIRTMVSRIALTLRALVVSAQMAHAADSPPFASLGLGSDAGWWGWVRRACVAGGEVRKCPTQCAERIAVFADPPNVSLPPIDHLT